MLLMAGLVGLFISGVLVALPMPGGGDASDEMEQEEQPEKEAEDLAADATADEAESGVVPAPVILSDQETDENVSPRTGGEQASPGRDQIGGDHLADRIGGSASPPIPVDGDAHLGNGSNDRIVGSDANDMIEGNDGDDTLDGGHGRDILSGGRGTDVLTGGTGDDQLHGDDGDDLIVGGDGNDLVSGGDGNDLLSGGDGDDRIVGGEGRDSLDGGAGDDILDGSVLADDGTDRDEGDLLSGGAGQDTLAGGTDDTLTGGSGSDLFLFRAASAGSLGLLGDLDQLPLIDDFDPAEDVIEIDFSGDDVPFIRIVEADGETHILLDDVPVVRLTGNPALESSNIRLIPSP